MTSVEDEMREARLIVAVAQKFGFETRHEPCGRWIIAGFELFPPGHEDGAGTWMLTVAGTRLHSSGNEEANVFEITVGSLINCLRELASTWATSEVDYIVASC